MSTERKLFRVRVGRDIWYPDLYETRYVEADNHEMAAKTAVAMFNDTHELKVSALQVPFAAVRGGENSSSTDFFNGDGERTYELTASKVEAYLVRVSFNFFPVALSAICGFAIAAGFFAAR